MSKEINLKTYCTFGVVFMILATFLTVASQTQEKIAKDRSQINKESSADGIRISGIVTMKTDDQPIARTKIEIRGTNSSVMGIPLFTNKTFTDERGRWALDNVPNGNYVVLVDPTVTLLTITTKDGQKDEIRSGVTAKFVAQTFEVKMAGADISDLAVQVVKGGRITGKVIMQDSEPLPEGLIVLPEQTIKTGRSPLRFAPVNPDGTFTLDAVPIGKILIKAVVYGKPQEYYMKSTTSNGKDLLPEAIDVEDNSEVRDVNIILAKKTNK